MTLPNFQQYIVVGDSWADLTSPWWAQAVGATQLQLVAGGTTARYWRERREAVVGFCEPGCLVMLIAGGLDEITAVPSNETWLNLQTLIGRILDVVPFSWVVQPSYSLTISSQFSEWRDPTWYPGRYHFIDLYDLDSQMVWADPLHLTPASYQLRANETAARLAAINE